MKIPLFISLAFWWLPLVPASAEIVINEIMYSIPRAPNVPEATDEEFIEILNTGPAAVSLTGWEIDAGVSFTFPATTLAANGYLVVSANPAAFAVKYPFVTATVLGPWTGRLSNSGEKIRLRNEFGEEIDELTYADQGDWARRRRGPLVHAHRGWVWESSADGGGGSLELVNPTLTNREGQNWRATAAGAETPGTRNRAFARDSAPLILEVKHSPAIPNASDRVVITADLKDLPGETLFAFVSFGTNSNSASGRIERPMFDDGLNGDGDAGDGTFGVTLPTFPDGTVVDFYIAADDGSTTRTWPAPSDDQGNQGANALFQIEDTPFKSDQNLPVYRLVLSPAENDEFAYVNFNYRGDAQMNATFIHQLGDDTDIRYLSGIRRRGKASRRKSPRTMRLTLANDRLWQDTSKLNLNSQFNYLQVFGMKMFAASRVVSTKGRAVELVLNGKDEANFGAAPYGAYVHMEPQGSESVARQFPDDPSGSLYKARRPDRKLAYRNGNIAQYLADGWSKATNSSEADWSDIDAWLGALHDSDNPDYLTNLEAVMDIDQWVRWFGVMTLLGNVETNLSNGADDDFLVYAGRLDRRIKAVPHDLDTILGLGEVNSLSDPRMTIYDMIERGDSIPVLVPFMREPSVLRRYHQALADLIEGPFSKETFDELLTNCLGERVPPSVLDFIISYMDARRAFVLSEINPDLTVATSLPLINGVPTATDSNFPLAGMVNLWESSHVLVNGQPAAIDQLAGTWSYLGGTLNPGMNRVVVESLDSEGSVIGTTGLEIWFDDGDSATVPAALSSDTILTAAAGPHLITGDLVVPAGVTLTIEAGASVIFSQGAGITVRGRLAASGARHRRIQLGVAPGSGDTWDGLVFSNTSENNRMAFLDQSSSNATAQSVGVENARLTLANVSWRSTTKTVLKASNPRVNVLDCLFPSSIGGPVIKGANLSNGQFFNLIGNVFQTSPGGNNIIEFSGGRRPGPILRLINNDFQGSADDCLELAGADAHIEGNIFRNVHTNDPARPDTSNAISADGDAHLTIVRNIFDDVDHALLLKNESDAVFENNVVRKATLGAISFREPLLPAVDAGSGVSGHGNIFIDNAVTFRFPNHPRAGGGAPDIIAGHNILPTAEHLYGFNNLDADPAFVDPSGGDFRLLPGSAASGTGINGRDMGAVVPSGVSISGEPPALTDETSATLRVHMPGISGIESGSFTTEYRWRLDGGAWSSDTDIAQPIVLSGLASGTHQVEVLGKDSAGVWQTTPEFSETWTIIGILPPVVRINEIVADSSSEADWIELYNAGSAPADLGGLVLSDDPSGMPGDTLAPGSILPAKGYLRVTLGSTFSLDRDGETLFLLDGATVVDSVTFGHQLTGFSLSRLGRDGTWGLGKTTPEAVNKAARTGDARLLKINEWVSDSRAVICDDFVELYNPGPAPVPLGGLFLTENPGPEPRQYAIPPLTFIEAGGFVALDFSMTSDSRNVALCSSDLEEIDLVAFTSQVEDSSYIRIPDGSGTIIRSPLPTPGRSNGNPDTTITTNRVSLVPLGATWSYDDTGIDRGTTWREPGFDDSAWSTGPALIGYELSPSPAPGIQTPLPNPLAISPRLPTYYFRTEFNFAGDFEATNLLLNTVFDDGGVVYLNGEILHRENIAGDPTFNSSADIDTTAVFTGPFVVPAAALVNGVNVIAVEIHQWAVKPNDILFGLSLDARRTSFTPGVNPGFDNALQLMANLRITEVMYDPAEGTEFEFIELQNVGSTPLQLEGVRFAEGISFVFPQMTLAPGAFVLLVSDKTSFESKYGAGLPVVGEYKGKLSNGGEELALQLPEPFAANIQKFTYNDSWYPASDGNGSAIEIIDPRRPVREWDRRLVWRAGPIDGTPGSDLSIGAGTYQVVLVNQAATLNGTIQGDWTPALSWGLVTGPAFVNFSSTTAATPSVTFTKPGTYRFRLSAAGDGRTLDSEVSVAVDDRYDLWSARNGLSTGTLGDEDGDSLVNLQEYALDSNPAFAENMSIFVTNDDDLRYTRYLRKSDLFYQIESSADLANWVIGRDTLLSTSPDQQILSHPLGGGPRRFFRLKVQR